MKSLVLTAALSLFAAAPVKAQSFYNLAYTTFGVVGVSVTSGTSVLVNTTTPVGFSANVAFYRITNNHPNIDIYLGDINVSTDTVCPSCRPGHVLKAAGDYIDWPVNKDPRNAIVNRVPIYAKAADTAYVGLLPRLSVIWFGF